MSSHKDDPDGERRRAALRQAILSPMPGDEDFNPDTLNEMAECGCHWCANRLMRVRLEQHRLGELLELASDATPRS